MLPAAPHLAGGLRVVATPADGGGFAAGVPAATAVSDTVPAAALGVRQVPLAAAPPVLAAAAEGGGGGGRVVLVLPMPGGEDEPADCGSSYAPRLATRGFSTHRQKVLT